MDELTDEFCQNQRFLKKSFEIQVLFFNDFIVFKSERNTFIDASCAMARTVVVLWLCTSQYIKRNTINNIDIIKNNNSYIVIAFVGL